MKTLILFCLATICAFGADPLVPTQSGAVAVPPNTRTISAGAGMSGGGNLTANRTLTWAPDTFVNNITIWDSSQASRTLTFGLSGATDPVWTIGNNSMDLTTGVLKYGGNTVATSANDLSFFGSTTSLQLKTLLSDETGSGAAVFATSPSFTTPDIGAATGTSLTMGGTNVIGSLAGKQPLQTGLTTGTIPKAASASTFSDGPIQVSSTTNITVTGGASVDNLIVTNGITSGSSAAGSLTLGDGGTHSFRIAPSTITTSINFIPPAAPFTGLMKYTVSGTTNFTGSQAAQGTDYYAPGGTDVALADGGTGASTAAAALDNLITAEATVASATTTDLGAVTSQNVQITGTTTITGFGTATAGIRRWGRFAGALTLTHNATSLILPGAANITTAANDRFHAISLGSGNWFVYSYQKADGTALVSSGGGGGVTNTVAYGSALLTQYRLPVPDSTGTNLVNSYVDQNGLYMMPATNGAIRLGSTTNGFGHLVIGGSSAITASDPIRISQTWNNAGVAFTGILLNVTNTASDSASRLIDLQVGGSTVLYVLRGGDVILGSGGFYVGGGTGYNFTSRGGMNAPSDGNFVAYNNAGTANATMSFRRVQSTKTANYTVTGQQGNTVFDNQGTTARVDFTLVAGATTQVGTTLTFYCADTDGLRVYPNAADTVQVNTSTTTASTGYVATATIGESITITYIGNNKWVSTGYVGNLGTTLTVN